MNVGDVIDGKYRIESKLGSGGMAVVYAARHLRLDEEVALKFLDPKLRASGDAKRRFQREAKSAFMLRSEHVVRTLDVGTTQDGTPFIVMELLKGENLAKWVEANGRPSVRDAISFTAQACEGVAEAHARGIVHRDIKPENLFVTPRLHDEPLVRVLDFGISKAILGENEHSLTGTNEMIGTPEFMSPEQFSHAKNSDPRADVWSLGIILYWLLTGKTPFEAPSPMGVMSAIMTRKPGPASALNPDVPRDIDAVIAKCITQERKSRFDDAADLLHALIPHLNVKPPKPASTGRLFAGPPSSGPTEPHTRRDFAPPSFGDVPTFDATGEDAPTQVDPRPAVRLQDDVAEENTQPKRTSVGEDARTNPREKPVIHDYPPSSSRTAVMEKRSSSIPAPPPRTERYDHSSSVLPPIPLAPTPPASVQGQGLFVSTMPIAQPAIDPRGLLAQPTPQHSASIAPPAPRLSQPMMWQAPSQPISQTALRDKRNVVNAVVLGLIGVIIGVFLMLAARSCSQASR